MGLFWRIWAVALMVTLLVMVVFVSLAMLQFGNVHATLVGERLVVLADRTVAPFAGAVRLGLPLSTVRNAQALLERARQTDEEIIAIDVFDPLGQVVHSTARDPARQVPAVALQAHAAASGQPWFRETPQAFLGSVNIPAPDGTSAGGILVHYPKAGGDTQVRAILAELVLAAGAVLMIAMAVSAGLLRWGLRLVLRRFDEIEADYHAFEAAAWRHAAGAPPEPAVGPFHEELAQAERRYGEALRGLAAEGRAP